VLIQGKVRPVLSVLSRGKLTTLTFHKVPVTGHPLAPDEPNLAALEAVLRATAKTFRILPLHDAMTAMRAGRLPDNAACITFDDGYPDWRHGVIPLLERLGMHATFFITCEQLQGRPMWNERILHAVQAAPATTPAFPLTGLSPTSVRFDSEENRRLAVRALDRSLKYLTLAERERWLQQLHAHTGSDPADVACMAADDVRTIHAKGFGIGAHSVSHPILRLCTEQEAAFEIGAAKEQLESLVRAPITAFAYPNGIPGRDFNAEHVRLVRRAGYQFALTTRTGVATAGTSLFQVPRFTPWGPSDGRVLWQLARNLVRKPAMLAERDATHHRALMVAFHFPPQAGSSGILRTLNFIKHLPRHHWEPSVLAVTPGAFEECRDDLVSDIPPQVNVIRARALDAARHLSIKGKYPQVFALPDRWASWWPAAVLAGRRAIREQSPHLIWSTYPISTAHLIGRSLARWGGLPWIADFRDPMINGDYPSNPLQRKVWQWLETAVLRDASRCVFTTERAAQTYRGRYPQWADKCVVIENGYDEGAFAGNQPNRQGAADHQLLLLHSGIIYPRDRDPGPFFAAVAQMLAQGQFNRETLRVRFRAPKHADEVLAMAVQHGLEDIVEVAPPIPYRQAIAEIMAADLLLVFQGSHFNTQIPAKIYEYLRSGRPILGLVDPTGDTAEQLRAFQGVLLADISESSSIAERLSEWQQNPSVSHEAQVNAQLALRFSRELQVAALAQLMQACVDEYIQPVSARA
jgi:peptidoglycan/xylan/chitin deacetylase (PgdA/CDA1 family)/glycosyltransferase involved in cell wall biosynthesis